MMEKPMPDVEVFTQPWCPFCAQAMRLLDSKRVAYREIDAPHGSAARVESIRRSGGVSSVPQIFIDGQRVGGCDDLMALDAEGRLDRLLQIA